MELISPTWNINFSHLIFLFSSTFISSNIVVFFHLEFSILQFCKDPLPNFYLWNLSSPTEFFGLISSDQSWTMFCCTCINHERKVNVIESSNTSSIGPIGLQARGCKRWRASKINLKPKSKIKFPFQWRGSLNLARLPGLQLKSQMKFPFQKRRSLNLARKGASLMWSLWLLKRYFSRKKKWNHWYEEAKLL